MSFTPVNPSTDPRVEQELAWIGDAVLGLWAREKILREAGVIDPTTFRHLTCNAFLQAFGRPTRVEAEIGLVYQNGGLAAANAYIETRLLPTYEKQAANRRRQNR